MKGYLMDVEYTVIINKIREHERSYSHMKWRKSTAGVICLFLSKIQKGELIMIIILGWLFISMWYDFFLSLY